MGDDLESIVEIPIGRIERGFYQPRDYFPAEAMEATRLSIQEKGQKYPVLVRVITKDNPLFDPTWGEIHYELADGERRYRCCKDLGFKTIKALVRELSDEEMLDHTLTTNDALPLNPLERAAVYSRLAKEFGKSQAEIAKSFHFKQQQVSEYIRLLELPKEVQDLTARAVISMRHARELLKLGDSEKISEMANLIQKGSISTREISKFVKKSKENPGSSSSKVKDPGLVKLSVEPNVSALPSASSPSKAHKRAFNPIISLHRALIPAFIYEKWSFWLSSGLGTTLSPEEWAWKVELSLFFGLIFAILPMFWPDVIGACLRGVLATVVFYIFLAA